MNSRILVCFVINVGLFISFPLIGRADVNNNSLKDRHLNVDAGCGFA